MGCASHHSLALVIERDKTSDAERTLFSKINLFLDVQRHQHIQGKMGCETPVGGRQMVLIPDSNARLRTRIDQGQNRTGGERQSTLAWQKGRQVSDDLLFLALRTLGR